MSLRNRSSGNPLFVKLVRHLLHSSSISVEKTEKIVVAMIAATVNRYIATKSYSYIGAGKQSNFTEKREQWGVNDFE